MSLTRVGTVSDALGIQCRVHAALARVLGDQRIVVEVAAALRSRVGPIKAALEGTVDHLSGKVVEVGPHRGYLSAYSSGLRSNEGDAALAQLSSVHAVLESIVIVLLVADLSASLPRVHLRARVVSPQGVSRGLRPARELDVADEVALARLALAQELLAGSLEGEGVLFHAAHAHVALVVLRTGLSLALALASAVIAIRTQALKGYVTRSAIVQ